MQLKESIHIFFSVIIAVAFATYGNIEVIRAATSTIAGEEETPTTPCPEEQTSEEPCEETPSGPSREELEAQIKARADALEQVNKKLEETQEHLRTTQSQKANLQKELKTLDYNVNQLELNIQAGEITSEKLGLEIESLNYDIRDIEFSVEEKKKAISYILREMQQKEAPNLLTVFLKNGTLADGVFEAHALTDIRNRLDLDITNLKDLHNQMGSKVSIVNSKLKEVEQNKKTLKVKKVIVQDKKEEKKVVLAVTQNKESAYSQQLTELQSQQNAISDEIEIFEKQLREAFDVGVLPVARSSALGWPVVLKSAGGKGTITQHFGEKSRLYRGKPHNGLDIGAPIGTPVLAAEDGVVMAVDNNDKSAWRKYQYGRYILIKHESNLATLYAHLSQQSVRKGETVRRGDIIGYTGNTGYSTGPHLHFGAYWAPSIEMKSVPPAAGLVPIGVSVSPEDYL